MSEPKLHTKNILDALAYLQDGGLMEVSQLTAGAMRLGQPKVEAETALAMALCLLADETYKLRIAVAEIVAANDAYDETEQGEARCHAAIEALRFFLPKQEG